MTTIKRPLLPQHKLRLGIGLLGCALLASSLFFTCARDSNKDSSDDQANSTAETTSGGTTIISHNASRLDLLVQLRELRKQSKDVTTLATDAQAALSLFEQTLAAKDQAQPFAELAQLWRDQGFELTRKPRGHEIFWVLREQEEHLAGRGFFVLRKSASEPISLQVPHGESDLMTDEIGMLLCMDHPFRSCAFNTVHRRVFDLVSAQESYFISLMTAELSADEPGAIAQLHGFDRGKRTSLAGQRADVILANGDEKPDDLVWAAAKSLMHDQPAWLIGVYGADVFELGATNNLQAASLRKAGRGRFLHMEINLEKRQHLVSDAAVRQSLFPAILAGSRGHQ